MRKHACGAFSSASCDNASSCRNHRDGVIRRPRQMAGQPAITIGISNLIRNLLLRAYRVRATEMLRAMRPYQSHATEISNNVAFAVGNRAKLSPKCKHRPLDARDEATNWRRRACISASAPAGNILKCRRRQASAATISPSPSSKASSLEAAGRRGGISKSPCSET